jgi:hypothetical protein
LQKHETGIFAGINLNKILKNKVMKIKIENYANLKRHLENLALIANCSEWEALKIYEKLRRIELKANRLATMECNGEIEGDENRDEKIKKSVLKLLPGLQGFFLNGDPRGYSLKIKEDVTKLTYPSLCTDWGGYGILAPEF